MRPPYSPPLSIIIIVIIIITITIIIIIIIIIILLEFLWIYWDVRTGTLMPID